MPETKPEEVDQSVSEASVRPAIAPVRDQPERLRSPASGAITAVEGDPLRYRGETFEERMTRKNISAESPARKLLYDAFVVAAKRELEFGEETGSDVEEKEEDDGREYDRDEDGAVFFDEGARKGRGV